MLHSKIDIQDLEIILLLCQSDQHSLSSRTLVATVRIEVEIELRLYGQQKVEYVMRCDR